MYSIQMHSNTVLVVVYYWVSFPLQLLIVIPFCNGSLLRIFAFVLMHELLHIPVCPAGRLYQYLPRP